MFIHRGSVLLAAILVFSSAVSCGGSTAITGAQAVPAAAVQHGAAAGFGGMLPAPADLDKGISEIAPNRWRNGGEYLQKLCSGDNVHPKLDQLLMQPVYEDQPGLAWAGFRFWLPDYGGGDDVFVDISPEGLPTPGSLYLGLANWNANRWDFFSVPGDGNVASGVTDPYIRSGDDLLYAVLLNDGQDDTAINGLRIGAELELTAILRASDYLAPAPAFINLLASHSVDFDGEIVKYEFEPFGDGDWEDNGNNPVLFKQYAQPGQYQVGLRVTDNDGNTATDTLLIIIDGPGYNETEDNDSYETAQQIPVGTWDGFDGNIGEAGAQDGDNLDCYGFQLDFPADIGIRLDIPLNSWISHRLIRADGGQYTLLEQSDPMPVSKSIHMNLLPGRYYVVVENELPNANDDFDYELRMDYQTSEPPVLVLADMPAQASQDSFLQIDLTGSYDPDGTIVSYQYDLYGDGDYETELNNPQVLAYDVSKRPGIFNAAFKVVDDTGLEDVMHFVVEITGEDNYEFSEAEPNDDIESANLLPEFDFEGLYGSLGGDISGSDEADFYSFTTEFQGTISFSLDIVDEYSGELWMQLLRWDGNGWVEAAALETGIDGDMASIQTSPPGDYLLKVHRKLGSSRYYIAGEFTPTI